MWIQYINAQPEPKPERAMVMRVASEVVGVCGFKDVDEAHGTAEYGYWVGVEYWGRGYATEATRQAVRVAFRDWGLTRLYARPLVRNHASCRVLEKAGFSLMQYMKNPFAKWPPEDLIAYYQIERSAPDRRMPMQ